MTYPTTLDDDSTLLVAVNNCSALLAVAYTAGGTSLDLDSAGLFPSTGGVIYVGNERTTYTGKTSNTLTGVSPLSNNYAIGAVVNSPVDASHHNLLKDAVVALETKVGVTGSAVAGTLTKRIGDVETGYATKTYAETLNTKNLTNILYPSKDGLWRDTYRAGWLPWSFNQQWGGMFGGQIINGATGALVEGDFLTGNVQDDNVNNVGSAAGNYFQSCGFKVSRTVSNPTIWLKLSKTGNPTTLTVSVRADSGGSPTGADLGTATISGKQVTSKADGEWYAFTPTVGSLTAGTQYHIVATMGTTSGTDYFSWKETTAKKYPHGFRNSGTSAPVWSQVTTDVNCFLIQAPAASAFLQSSGQFDSKFTFSGAGSVLDQSDALVQPLRNFWDGKQFTDLIRGTWTKAQPIKDYQYGIDHDRILLTCNTTTGYAQVDVWDSGGTKRTVTGTTDVSTGFHDVSVAIRSVGDGADYIKLYVDGASQGTPLTSLTLTFDPMFRELGHATLGGANAFSVPTWSGSSISTFSGLPSTLGWTYTGTATEANAFSVSGGKLYQNKNGYGSTDTGYYTKTTAGLSNANGWIFTTKFRVPSNTNTAGSGDVAVQVYDGTKLAFFGVHEYFAYAGGDGTPQFYVQGDFKSQEHVFTLIGKGSDYYLFIDGKLAVDGTGKLTYSTATNQIQVSDQNVAASENADAIWSYVKYYTTAAVLPQFTSGSLSEFAHWSGDRTAILSSLYNSGTPVSVKSYCGVEKNYVGEGVVQVENRTGVSASPTTTSTAYPGTVLAEMECFAIGSQFSIDHWREPYHGTAGATSNFVTAIDGAAISNVFYAQLPNVNQTISMARNDKAKTVCGLHKVDARFWTNSGTLTDNVTHRRFQVEARS